MTTDGKPAFWITPCNATALRKASRRLTQLYDAALAPTGLRSTQLAILVELANRGSLTFHAETDDFSAAMQHSLLL